MSCVNTVHDSVSLFRLWARVLMHRDGAAVWPRLNLALRRSVSSNRQVPSSALLCADLIAVCFKRLAAPHTMTVKKGS